MADRHIGLSVASGVLEQRSFAPHSALGCLTVMDPVALGKTRPMTQQNQPALMVVRGYCEVLCRQQCEMIPNANPTNRAPRGI